jgi:hypothetical protein
LHKHNEDDEHALPIKRDLTLAYLVSLVIALVMASAAIADLLSGAGIYPGVEAKVLPLFFGQDARNLAVGLPMLIGSMRRTRRGALIGLLLWPGALFYILYDYGYYVVGAPFHAFFLPYLALMTLSAYTIIGIFTSFDGNAVCAKLVGAVPSRLVSGVLAVLALLFMTLWTGMTVSALVSGVTLDPIPHVVVIMDLTVQLPGLLIGGVLLWRRESVACVIAVGLLLQAGVYLIGLSVITVLQEVVMPLPFDPIAVVPGCLVGAICLGLIRPFLRGATGPQRAAQLLTQSGQPC